MTDAIFEGASEVVRKIQDLRWHAAREVIEAYGREMYERGAQKLLERLAEEADRAVSEEHAADCLDCQILDLTERVPLEQADGSPEACT